MSKVEQKPTRPLLRYHGGKWLLAPWIISQFPAHRVYCEPYGGGGSVLLRKDRSYAEVYNDLDGEIVNLFRVVRDNGDELVRAIELTPFSRTEFELSYQPQASNPVEQARRTMMRSFMGFGSAAACGAKTGFRNRSGTPPARDWMNYPAALGQLVERLRGVVIENRDAKEVMIQHDTPDTLHYLDPPYVLETRSMANPYCKKVYRHEMTDIQHEELAEVLHSLKGSIVLSGYDCPLYTQLYASWRRVEKTGPFADGARERTEVLWIKNVTDDLFTLPAA